ncbi:MAG TPA: hypothetical protein VHW24_26230, partial [Bryobacteraceae bacterium]|nr:hypothetical protein [Bryobacteraceae bacterium]
SRLETRYFVQPKFRWDDRSDDCAFGAMMLLALRQKFRKLRFQMIANIVRWYPAHASDCPWQDR